MLITGVRTLTQALAAPALSSSVTGSTATLSWTPPTPTGQSVIAGYRVYKSSTLAGTYTQIGGALPSSQTSLTDTLSATSFYQIEAFDQFTTGRRSSASQCTYTPAGAIKLPVGNGFWFDNQFWYNSTFGAGAEQTAFLNNFNTLSANTNIKFVYISLTWGHAEGPTRGDYSRAFNAIDAILAKLATATHQIGLIIEIWQTFFNTQSTTDLNAWPQYVVNNNWVIACIQAGAQRTQLKWDIDDVWAAYGDMCAAICSRYNSHPLFYGFSTMDESVAISVVDNVAQPGGLSPGQTILNSTHYNNQFLALQLRLLPLLTNTMLYVPFNYLPPGDGSEVPVMANMINTIEAQSPKHALYGGPDPFLRQTTFQKMVAGLLPASGLGDIRHQVLLINRTQEAFLNNSTPTPTTNYDTALANNAVLLCWNCETWLTWKFADQLAAINAHGGAAGTPPAGGNYQIL